MNAIYATLAALPLLIVYLQLTWTVILAGAELAFAVQHHREIRGPQQPRAPHAVRERLALHVMVRACRRFETDDEHDSARGALTEVSIPTDWTESVLEDLAAAGLIGRIEGGGLMPLRVPSAITAADVVGAVRGSVNEELDEQLALPDAMAARLAEIEAAERAQLREMRLGV